MNTIANLSPLSNELIPTSDGTYTIKYQDKFVHSSRSPIKEAQKLILNIPECNKKNTLILAWGTGLGYHIELLIQQGYHVLAIEHRPYLAKIFSRTFPLQKLVGFIPNSYSNELFDHLVTLDQTKFTHFIDLPMFGLAIPTNLYQQSQQGKNALISLHQIRYALIESWYYNIIQNISLLHYKNIGYTFDPIFQNQTLVICSAGPSLKESLPYIKQHRSQITLLVVDTALQTLLQADIIPDFVHAVDAKIHNIGDFRGISQDIIQQITLIADITLSYQITSLPWKNILFVSTSHPITKENKTIIQRTNLQEYLWNHNIRFPETQTGGSVATSAFHLGVLYKANKILLVGQDLAYSNNRGHSVGSPYDMEYRLQTTRLNSLDNIHIHKVPFNTPVITSIDTKNTYADSLLTQFKSWFENSIQDNPNLKNVAINCSINGAFFKNWIHMPISQYNFSKNQQRNSYILKSFDPKLLYNVLQQLQNLPINIDQDNPISHEFFYKELHFSEDTHSHSINKKTKLLSKKIEDSLCQLQ